MDKVGDSLMKELEYYSRILEKHKAMKKEKQLKSTITQQTRTGQQLNKPISSHSYKVVKNHSNPVLSFNQNYLFKKSTHPTIISKKNGTELYNQNYLFKKSTHPSIMSKKNGTELYNQRQKFNSIYSLSKNNVSTSNKFAVNRSNASIMHAKSVSDSKTGSVKVPSISSNGSEKLTYNTKDFIREVESVTELMKKQTSESHKVLKSPSTRCKNVIQDNQSDKKAENNAFHSISHMKKETVFSKAKGFVEMSSRIPANVNYANRIFFNSNNKNNPPHLNKSVYKKNNVKHINTSASLMDVKNVKDGFQKIISRPVSRKVILSDSKKLSCDLYTSSSAGVFQAKPLMSDAQQLILKLHTPNKFCKKSPYVTKLKSPALFKVKSNVVKSKIIQLKQTNTRYKKVNKNLTTPNKRVQLQHPSQHKSLKKIKKKVNNKYKVINKTLTPSSNQKTAKSLSHSVCKNNSPLSLDCDTFLKGLNDSAVEKLEQNLLVISSELTAPLSSEKNKGSDNKLIQPSIAKMNSKLHIKRTPFKKSKSSISTYKVINSNISQKYSLKNMQSVHITPLRRERAVLVRRLFKSKNVIINKNASPTNYSAKMIKTKYLLLNKRKSGNWQKYRYPTTSLYPKFKGHFLATKLHPKQGRFKTTASSPYHSRLIRKTNYGYQTYKNKKTYKNSGRKVKNKIGYSHSPVVFIRGTKYAININGKTLRKLPIKGSTAKNFQRTSSKLIMKTPENWMKISPASANMASRVLHRSINRILMASSKKNMSKVNTYCMFYNRFGRCNRGVKCTYIHDPSKIAVCTRFLRGTCKNKGCPFSHEVDPGKMAICSFFLVGQCDKENCCYRHEKLSPNAVLCKDFVQGYCHYGKECKKAHILICPKYMQGECDKGSLCAFPHPPQKAKKNILKEAEDEETKPPEVLLEKVLRYFQQGGHSQSERDGNTTTNLFVPKQKKLCEQPSFIPLNDSPPTMHNK